MNQSEVNKPSRGTNLVKENINKTTNVQKRPQIWSLIGEPSLASWFVSGGIWLADAVEKLCDWLSPPPRITAGGSLSDYGWRCLDRRDKRSWFVNDMKWEVFRYFSCFLRKTMILSTTLLIKLFVVALLQSVLV